MQLIGHQGDAVFFKVKKFPKNLIQDAQTKAGIIADGTGSGHAHQFADLASVELFKSEDGKLIYCDVTHEATVTHGRSRIFNGKEADTDYHNPVTLQPGLYAVGIVDETDWINKTIRRVVD